MKIAIDGPGGAGKSTFAKLIAKEFSLVYVDTGALYRAIGLSALRLGIDPKDADGVVPMLDDTHVALEYRDGAQCVILNGEDVSGLIRTSEVSMYASAVSAIPAVRSFLLKIQKDMVARGNVVMDGRDIGTVIMPDADVKFFLVADPEVRARRRYKELCDAGKECSYEDILRDIEERDKNDSERALCPLVPADDAIMFDNSGLNIPETLDEMKRLIEERTGEAAK